MQQKFLKVLSILMVAVVALIGLNSCWKKPDPKCGTIKTNYTAPYRFNEIGILGTVSINPYIEVQYTTDAGNGSNKIVTQWVSPPCLVGGQPVVCNYDSIYQCADGQVRTILPHVQINYDMGGAEYMKIINHGSNPIEYFIAGTQDTVSLALSKLGVNTSDPTLPAIRTIDIMPFVQYNNTPIYYLLHPDKIPHADLFNIHLYLPPAVNNNNFSYTGVYDILTKKSDPTWCGNLHITQAWSVEDVMKLYRAEYKQSTDTALMLCFDYIKDSYDRPLADRRISTGYGGKIGLNIQSNAKFYGMIQPNDTLQAAATAPLITHYSASSGTK